MIQRQTFRARQSGYRCSASGLMQQAWLQWGRRSRCGSFYFMFPLFIDRPDMKQCPANERGIEGL